MDGECHSAFVFFTFLFVPLSSFSSSLHLIFNAVSNSHDPWTKTLQRTSCVWKCCFSSWTSPYSVIQSGHSKGMFEYNLSFSLVLVLFLLLPKTPALRPNLLLRVRIIQTRASADVWVKQLQPCSKQHIQRVILFWFRWRKTKK